MTQSTSRRVPEVSIGLPVYNGAEYLAESIDSLLNQTFRDFELIISDNASTDRTPEICADYCRRDPRVRHIRLPRNIGAAPNWNLVVREAAGTFFLWASANDRCEPEMLSKCVDVLRRDFRVVLCYGRTLLIDDDGRPIEIYKNDLHVTHHTPSARFIYVRDTLLMNNAQYALMRLDILKQTGLDRLYATGDLVLMAELALWGYFCLLPDVLFHRRMGRGAANQALSGTALKAHINAAAPNMVMIRWRVHLDCLGSVLRSPIPWAEQWRALVFSLKSAYWDRKALFAESKQVLQVVARRMLPRAAACGESRQSAGRRPAG